MTLILPIISQAETQNNRDGSANIAFITVPAGGSLHFMGHDLVKDAVENKAEKLIKFTGKLTVPSDEELKRMISKFEPGDKVLTVDLKEVYKANGVLNKIEQKQLKNSMVDFKRFEKLLTMKSIAKEDLHKLLFEALKSELAKGAKFSSFYRVPERSYAAMNLSVGKLLRNTGILLHVGTAVVVGKPGISAMKNRLNNSDRTIASKNDLDFDSKVKRPAYGASKQ